MPSAPEQRVRCAVCRHRAPGGVDTRLYAVFQEKESHLWAPESHANLAPDNLWGAFRDLGFGNFRDSQTEFAQQFVLIAQKWSEPQRLIPKFNLQGQVGW